ncbi:T9SS type A sorting domain-containing protein [Porphyromonas gulae]|uniref:T9SS type A sorting domain-containing protein n=1 Tax=Porphyromonas gulae TaxID=111105 RepID=UPI0026E94BFF|nr:T9SS type A sorting domain-containing protein [Porphyromonas gulae]
MKKLLLASMAFLCVWIWNAGAQTMAPNYFHANPQQFKQRIAKVKIYSSDLIYEYGADNLLHKISTMSESGVVQRERRFSFNDAGYMIREEEYVGGDELQLIGKWEFDRNDRGYITHFRRFSLKEEGLELAEDIRIDFVYDADMKLTKAEMDFFDVTANDWFDLRTTNLVYNENGLLKEMIQIDPESGEEFNREVLTYNKLNKIVSIRFIPGPASTGEYETEWIYEYDSQGEDIVKAGREDFWRFYEYDKEKLATETFIPRPTIADWVYFGPKNFMDFSDLPLDNSYEHVVLKETVNGTEATYEAIPASYTVTIVQPENGEIKLTADGQPVSSGSSLTEGKNIKIQPTPREGYEVDKVMVNGQSIEAPYEFVLKKDTEVTAVMKKTSAVGEVGTQSFRAYPVPTSNDLTIEIPAEMIGKTASIIDMNGQVVYRVVLGNLFQQIDLSHLKGVFLLQIGDSIERVIVQ